MKKIFRMSATDSMIVKMMMVVTMTYAIVLTSCEREDCVPLSVNIQMPDSMQTHKTVTFTFDGIEISPMTRASLSDVQMRDLWLFDYIDGSLAQTIHQVSSDDGFGTVSIDADYGEHTIYFVASRGDTPTVSGKTISWAKPSDTFWQTITLTIEPQTSSTQSVTLQRVATRLRITVTDEIPTTLATLNVTPSVFYYGLDYTTGEATDSRTTARTVNVPASYVGTSGQLSASFYCLSPSTAWQTDITLTAKASDASTISEISISDIPMQRNRITSFSGTLFSAGRSMTVSVDDAWGEENTGTW